MNKKLQLFLVTALSFIIGACTGTETLKEDPHYIRVIGDDLREVPWQETILDAEIDANCKWVISKTNSNGEGVSWIKVDVPNSTGHGPAKFRIQVLENDSDKPRSGMLNIYSDQITAIIDINQAANPDFGQEEEPFKGYSFPAYQWLGTSSFTSSGSKLKCDGGMIIEKSSGADLSVTNIETSLLPGFTMNLESGEGIIFKIPLTYPLYGDLRFMYGSKDENITSVDAYQWSTDEGMTWNAASRFETSSIPAFKSVYFSIPEDKMINAESWLWIKVAETSSNISMVGGMALTKAVAITSVLAPEDSESVVISEGFDNTVTANAAYLDAPEYMKSVFAGAWESENAAISSTACYARPGFVQVGSYDEAAAEAGEMGSIVIDVGARLQAMGITDKTDIVVTFKAAGIKNAHGTETDAKIVIKSSDEVLAQSTGLKADRFSDYKFHIQGVDNSTVLTITGQGDGTDTRFFIDDLLVTVFVLSPPSGPLELTFDFTQPDTMSEWNTEIYPGLNKDYVFESYFIIDDVTYTFRSALPKDIEQAPDLYFPYYQTAAQKFTMPAGSYLALPAIPGLKLTKVSIYRDVGKHPQWGIIDNVYGGDTDDTKVFVSEPKETPNKEWGSHELTGTEAGKVYWINVKAGTLAFKQLTLNYEL